ncbi:hypothetical protein ETB97_000488 [Aspergillus alliaceus]|uniref:Uncharacterized protein n=1 Tax=Petromyces alliaceus TaxID=209559 RepID=A0A8H6A201_PETAA|nr:hypothetical protein ETB97_000488 [Aspergillus burnettii]
MWRLVDWDTQLPLWFSDGQPIDTQRPISDLGTRGGLSPRLIVDNLGFLDLTEVHLGTTTALDANGSMLRLIPGLGSSCHPDDGYYSTETRLELSLQIEEDGGFTLSVIQPEDNESASDGEGYIYIHTPSPSVSGKLRPIPAILQDDISFIKSMMEKKHVPYQNVPGPYGKSIEEIEVLSKMFFPFSNYNLELAVCVYDWTTGSFARNVFFKIFEYTGIPETPFPLDLPSIAEQIYTSNWGTYTPEDKDYMSSFMMKPAESLSDVQKQLANVSTKLHKLSTIENRVMSAAVQALPRTSIVSTPRLYSGQVDMRQLGLDHFGIEFLECHLNQGPVGDPLKIPFARFMESYVTSGKTLTTKAFWSSTNTMDLALKFSNGILLIFNPPPGSWVWDRVTLITPLSANEAVMEYTFLPGTQFNVQSVDCTKIKNKEVVVITLQLAHNRSGA